LITVCSLVSTSESGEAPAYSSVHLAAGLAYCLIEAAIFLSSAFSTAILNRFPDFCPFTAPGKRPVAGNAYFLRPVFFFNDFQN
jgi:hypothetical protein